MWHSVDCWNCAASILSCPAADITATVRKASFVFIAIESDLRAETIAQTEGVNQSGNAQVDFVVDTLTELQEATVRKASFVFIAIESDLRYSLVPRSPVTPCLSISAVTVSPLDVL